MSNTDTNETIGLRVSRQLPATPDEVFDAYTDAEKQKIWFSILDEEPGVVEIEVDLFRETQTFLEIDRPHRLVTESTGSEPDGNSMTTQVVVTFEPNDGGTLMTIEQTGFPTPEVRDFFETTALIGAFDRIEAYLVRESR
jgi:uncharacterized protein YndB with AHSA1/START domain